MDVYYFYQQSIPSKLLYGVRKPTFLLFFLFLVFFAPHAHLAYTQEPSVFETTINSISWHPQSTMVALGLEDGTYVIVDAQTREIEFSALVGEGSVHSVAWSSDGEHLAAGSYGGTLSTWDIAEQQLLHTWNITGKSGLLSVTWTPQNDYVISGFSDGITTLSVWDVETEELFTETSLSNINGFAWNPEGSKLATANFIGVVFIVDGETFLKESEYLIVGNETGRVTTVTWSPDGQFIAAGSIDGAIYIWDYNTQELIHSLDGNEGDVNSPTLDTGLTPDSNILNIAFSPDGNRLGSISTDGTVRIWDLVTGQVILNTSLVDESERISAAEWNPDRTQLAYGVRSSLNNREVYLEIIPFSLDLEQITSLKRYK